MGAWRRLRRAVCGSTAEDSSRRLYVRVSYGTDCSSKQRRRTGGACSCSANLHGGEKRTNKNKAGNRRWTRCAGGSPGSCSPPPGRSPCMPCAGSSPQNVRRADGACRAQARKGVLLFRSSSSRTSQQAALFDSLRADLASAFGTPSALADVLAAHAKIGAIAFLLGSSPNTPKASVRDPRPLCSFFSLTPSHFYRPFDLILFILAHLKRFLASSYFLPPFPFTPFHSHSLSLCLDSPRPASRSRAKRRCAKKSGSLCRSCSSKRRNALLRATLR